MFHKYSLTLAIFSMNFLFLSPKLPKTINNLNKLLYFWYVFKPHLLACCRQSISIRETAILWALIRQKKLEVLNIENVCTFINMKKVPLERRIKNRCLHVVECTCVIISQQMDNCFSQVDICFWKHFLCREIGIYWYILMSGVHL